MSLRKSILWFFVAAFLAAGVTGVYLGRKRLLEKQMIAAMQKTVVGDPIKVGSVTLIPILTVEVSFGGLGTAAPGAPKGPATGVDGFFMRGEARPLGFVAITRKGTRFISVVKTPEK